VIAFSGTPDGWAWLKGGAGDTALYTGGPGKAPVLVANGRGWQEVAVDGTQLWVLRGDGERGALLQLSSVPGSSPKEVLDNLQRPGGLFAQGGRLYWLEVRSGLEPGLAFLPAAGPIAQLRCREASGEVRTVGEYPAGEIGGRGEKAGAGPGDIVGAMPGAVVVRLRRLVTTEFLRFPLPAGPPSRIAGEPDLQDGALSGNELYWTAPSEEATPDAALRCARHARVDAPGAVPATITDWLPGSGTLLALDGAAYYAASSDMGLYRLPHALAPAEFVREVRGGSTSDGQSVVLLQAGEAPVAVPARAE